eukprot:scaffold7037_cov311-Pinguiococcus_pyrenoidosus.AAC.2
MVKSLCGSCLLSPSSAVYPSIYLSIYPSIVSIVSGRSEEQKLQGEEHGNTIMPMTQCLNFTTPTSLAPCIHLSAFEEPHRADRGFCRGILRRQSISAAIVRPPTLATA